MPPATEITVECLDGAPAPHAPPPTAASPPLASALPLPPTATRAAVVWTHRAEHQLQLELTRALGSAVTLAPRIAQLDERLRVAFRYASVIIVLETYIGFRPRDRENILLVDVRDGPDCGTAIVKLADDLNRLQSERGAWMGCVPVCFPGNAVFMRLQTRPDDGPPVALVYQDAQPPHRHRRNRLARGSGAAGRAVRRARHPHGR